IASWMLVNGSSCVPLPGGVPWTSTYQVVCDGVDGACAHADEKASATSAPQRSESIDRTGQFLSKLPGEISLLAERDSSTRAGDGDLAHALADHGHTVNSIAFDKLAPVPSGMNGSRP